MESYIQINVPAEYLDDISTVIREGLQRARIKESARTDIRAWWDVESYFVYEKLSSNNNETQSR